MITGAELKNKVDADKEHTFISFSVNEIRGELDYSMYFDKGCEEYLGDHNVIVSNLWIEDAILEVADTFSYEYHSWVDLRDQIVELIEQYAQSEYKTEVGMITGILANDNTRGGGNAS